MGVQWWERDGKKGFLGAEGPINKDTEEGTHPDGV